MNSELLRTPAPFRTPKSCWNWRVQPLIEPPYILLIWSTQWQLCRHFWNFSHFGCWSWLCQWGRSRDGRLFPPILQPIKSWKLMLFLDCSNREYARRLHSCRSRRSCPRLLLRLWSSILWRCSLCRCFGTSWRAVRGNFVEHCHAAAFGSLRTRQDNRLRTRTSPRIRLH